MNIPTKDKKVFIRVDFNVPLDSEYNITDDTRIRAAIPTILKVLDNGGSVILASHLGRPQKKKTADGNIDVRKFTLKHVQPKLSELLGRPVLFAEDAVSQDARRLAANLKPGQVLLLENTRFHPGEENGSQEMAFLLASMADVYVNDAFGTAHRAHASTAEMAKFFDKDHRSFGLLMEKELKAGDRLLNQSVKPFVAIVGGAKVSDKILLLEKLATKAQDIIIGGGMAYTFMAAMDGKIGNSLVENERIGTAKALLKNAEETSVRIHLPVDSVIADKFADDAYTKVCPSMVIPDGWMGLDIGPEAIQDFSNVIKHAKTILWNGPMGVFEMDAFSNGTNAIAKAVADATKNNSAYSLIGGGDSVSAINQSGLADQVSFISTGGGAMLELLEGKQLPGVKAIQAD